MYGSSRFNWPYMVDFANRNGLLSSISVGPGVPTVFILYLPCCHASLTVTACLSGYCDERIRPWNQLNTHDRKNGEYYRASWRAATSLNPSFISITSWNEWHEGTQIEDCMCVSLSWRMSLALFQVFRSVVISLMPPGQQTSQMLNPNGRT